MKKFLALSYALLTGILIAATFIEHFQGNAFATKYIYHSMWFCCLWGILACFVVVSMATHNRWKRLPAMLLHSSFLIILGGAMLTFFCGEKGYVHLKKGENARSFIRNSDNRPVPLPFTLRLDSFQIKYYPGTQAPSDYISTVTCIGEGKRFSKDISMNHVLSVKGYRFYQSSFDDDHEGSWISVNYDPIGIPVTYTGYLVLALSSIWLLTGWKETFCRLLRNPLLKRSGLAIVLLMACSPAISAQNNPRAISKEEAGKLETKQVIYQDRVVPFHTLARDFLLKLAKRTSYRGLSPEQVICSWFLYPEDWQKERIIYVSNKELREKLHVPHHYVSLNELFDGTTYKLEKLLVTESKNGNSLSPYTNSKLGKAILELDEKVGLILMLREGTLITPLPKDGSVKRLSDAKVKAEILYTQIPFAKILFMANLTLGILSFIGFLYASLNKKRSKRTQRITHGFACLLYLSCLFHWIGYGLRWYIGGRMPLSNGYETMLLLAGCMLIFSCWLQRRFTFILPFGFLLSGFVLLVAYLGEMNPQITPLMPVLQSPWLSIHVSLIMISYALYAYMLLNGVLAFCLCRNEEKVEQLMLFSKLMLYPATLFLGIGIFIGAVWANTSWGSYWSWDPKEVWALITFMIYGAAFHDKQFKWLRTPLHYHIYMIAAFLSVLMTYVGVNYFLSGMHSYA